jgi:membrane protease YdiL (CAAX protease family)
MDEHLKEDDASALWAKSQRLETGAFVFLILPSLLFSYFVGKQLATNFTVTALGTILRNLSFLCLIAFFAWKNGEPRERFGWVWSHAGTEAILGVWLFLLMSFSAILIQQALSAAHVSLPSHALPESLIAHSPAGYALAFALVVVVAICEETIFRGYLLLRLGAVFRSRAAAALVASLIFCLGHGYEGIAGVVAVFFIGLFLSVVYLWRKSIIAPAVIHFLQDLIGLFSAAFAGRLHG